MEGFVFPRFDRSGKEDFGMEVVLLSHGRVCTSPFYLLVISPILGVSISSPFNGPTIMTDNESNVHVSLQDRSYDITIGAGNLGRVAELAGAGEALTHAVVVTDSNVDQLHVDPVIDAFSQADVRTTRLVVDAGEKSKAPEVAARLWDQMLEARTDRRSMVVAVGGGVVGDLAGFLAATFVRGIRFFQVPTTLLAQVDSSVGGKVGINLPGGKNMVGAFKQPVGVLIDTQSLDTLSGREYSAGLAEVAKYGVILDAELFDYLEANVEPIMRKDHDVMQRVIQRCCRLKADVVEQDEFEQHGLRAFLNYGHTFGHPLETLLGYGEILHGEAVAVGMTVAARLAVRLGMFDRESADRQFKLLQAFNLPTSAPQLDPKRVIDVMMRDKKVSHGKLRLILPSCIGKVELMPAPSEEEVLAAFVE